VDAGAAHRLGEEDGAADGGAARGDHGLEGAPAAARALHFDMLNSGSVASILRNNLDKQPLPGDEPQQVLPLHENIRGGSYYH
jgi:hypothetical protein